MLSSKIKTDFLLRLTFGTKEGNFSVAMRTAYNDFARTLKTDLKGKELAQKKAEMSDFLLQKLKKIIALDIKTQEDFDEKHQELCHSIKAQWGDLTYGQIQKWVNMSLKYGLLFGEEKVKNIEKNARFFHIPIDSIIKEMVFGEKRGQKDYESWSKIESYEKYGEYQRLFREKFPEKIPIIAEFEVFNNSKSF